MATIYLSSTYEDLKDYRQAVFEALRKAGHQVIAMEDYVATDQRPVDKCLLDVEKANIYVGIFAFRYGYVPPLQHKNPKGWSITELEFRHAEELQKPCLPFVVNDTTAWPRSYDDARTAEDKGERINSLRQYLLTEKLASAFSFPQELSTLVLAAVAKHLEESKPPEPFQAAEAAKPAAISWDIQQQGSPYPGLMYFTRKYAPVFFGREAEVREILDRMRLPEGRFLIVSGDSGTGKSSVIGAGVLPHIEEKGLLNKHQACCVSMFPSQGRHLFSAFMGALNQYAMQAGLKPDIVADELTQAPERLCGIIKIILAEGIRKELLVLFLDQMEEVFTYTPAASKMFLKALFETAHARNSPLWVLATIRSDHLHHCHANPEMLQVLRGPGHFPLGPLEPFMLEDVIAEPARCAGLRISETLVRRIAHETKSKGSDDTTLDHTNLPLLAFVLNHLFEHRTDHELSEAVYQQMGGVTGAIAHHAAQVEADLHRQHGIRLSAMLSKLFESLVMVNPGGLPTRRRPLVADFAPEMREVIEFLVQKRLLRTEGQGTQATVSISHEKLFESWPSLKVYIDKNKTQLFGRTLLESRAKKWVEMEKRPWFRGLASGQECREYRRAGVTPTPEMRDYLYASRRKQLLFMSAVTVVAFLTLGTTWLWQKGYSLNQAGLKVQSIFMSIRVPPGMVPIPGGTYRQGDVEGLGEGWFNPVREVTIKPFAMGKYEVTFTEYDRFAIATGRDMPIDQGWGRGQRPVINVSWEDARDFADWLSRETGKSYRLPTESEWEYAARSGAKQEAWAGTSDETHLGEYAVYAANSNRTAEVGTKRPNAFGLNDLNGNVWEWVEDCWHENYQGAPKNGSAWLESEGGNCENRMIRGGSWYFTPEYLRSSLRYGFPTDNRTNELGFRLAQDTP